jgi:phosphate uptake regulator
MTKLRKVQQTRTGTFFVCLTRSWADKNGVKKGTQVALDETSDGKLCIDARVNAESLPKVAILSTGPFLDREILGRYLLGFDVIRVQAKERFDFAVRDLVKRTASSLIGLEIVAESSSELVLQCLLDVSGFPPEKLLNRNFSIVAGMCRDAVAALVDGDVQLAKSVVARDDESDRQYFLLVRVLRTIVQDAGLSDKLDLSAIDCLDHRLAASYVEALGDVAMQIANEALKLDDAKPSQELKSLLSSLKDVCCEASDSAVKAFTNKDLMLAEGVRNLTEKVNALSVEIEKTTQSQLLIVLACLRRFYDLSVDLSDLVV